MFANLNPTVWLTRLALALVLMLAGFVLGWRTASDRCAAALDAADNKLLAASAKQQIATDAVVTRFVDQQQSRGAARAALNKDIHDEVPADIVLPGVYRMLHDAAATATVPGAADLAAAGPVAAQDLAETVAENYAACEANRQQLIAVQEWVRSQQEITLH